MRIRACSSHWMPTAWPAEVSAIESARRFLRAAHGSVVVASHNDVDGLAAAVILSRTLRRAGGVVHPLPSRRGEHVHTATMREKILELRPDALIVADMGSRRGSIIDGLPTLVVDHHDASGGTPPGAVVVNGYDREPVASSSVLAYVICRELSGAGNAAWLGALGAVADLGSAAPFEQLLGMAPRGGAWRTAISLLNAARRAPEDDAATAFRVLDAAGSVEDIAAGRIEGVARLQAYRRTVQREVARCSRVPPAITADAALIRFSSAAQVHPLVATRWASRLAPRVVIAANDGFLPGRVNFAIRTAADVNLLQWLRALPFTPSADGEYANGHPRATGGSLSVEDFERFVRAVRSR